MSFDEFLSILAFVRSAPEKLVQGLLANLKKNRKVSIEEVVVAEEKVVFKLPKELN